MNDRRKLDEYLTAVREIEHRVDRADRNGRRPTCAGECPARRHPQGLSASTSA